jgi:hypothetical protein
MSLLFRASVCGFFVALAVVTVHVADAHICLTFPMQRGPAPSLLAGDPLCYHRTGCPLKRGAPTASFIVGVPTLLSFQQNFNHWSPANGGGYIDVSASYDGETTWQSLGTRLDDMPQYNMNTQTFFSYPAIFPKSGSAVVRVRYVSNNPNEVDPSNNTNAVFYNCADVIVTDGASAADVAAAKKIAKPEPVKAKGDFVCTTPPVWYATGSETITTPSGSMMPFMTHRIWYDQQQRFVKWTRSTQFSTYTDIWNLTDAGGYTPEFLIDELKSTCEMAGGDYADKTLWPDGFVWQYGMPGSNQAYQGTDSRGVATFLSNSGFKWTVQVLANSGSGNNTVKNQCVPLTYEQVGRTKTVFHVQALPSFPASTFALPASCKNSAAAGPTMGCKAHADQKKRLLGGLQ